MMPAKCVLTTAEQEVLDFVAGEFMQRGNYPSTRQVAEAAGLSVARTLVVLERLTELGMIQPSMRPSDERL
ncbi:MAG: hypothetical protein PHX83_14495 [Acidobacteriia bacterium]|nr:hypothetical protein [Terriglobia bacterium]